MQWTTQAQIVSVSLLCSEGDPETYRRERLGGPS